MVLKGFGSFIISKLHTHILYWCILLTEIAGLEVLFFLRKEARKEREPGSKVFFSTFRCVKAPFWLMGLRRIVKDAS